MKTVRGCRSGGERKRGGEDGFFEERKVGLGFFGIVEESDEGSARLLGACRS